MAEKKSGGKSGKIGGRSAKLPPRPETSEQALKRMTKPYPGKPPRPGDEAPPKKKRPPPLLKRE